MLIRMVVRAAGAAAQRLNRTVETAFPIINILAAYKF